MVKVFYSKKLSLIMKVSKTFHFNAWHRINGYEWVCSNVHWHNFVCEVVCSWEVDPHRWMVIDFKELSLLGQRIDETLDHAFLYQSWDYIGEYLASQWMKVLVFDTPPSSEHIAQLIYEKADELWFPIDSVVLWETPKCKVEYSG